MRVANLANRYGMCDPKRVTLDACDAEHSHFSPTPDSLVMPVLVTGIHGAANSGVSGSLDAGDKPRHDNRSLFGTGHKPGTGGYFSAARIRRLASSPSHSAGPRRRPISRPSRSRSRVAGRPAARRGVATRAVPSA